MRGSDESPEELLTSQKKLLDQVIACIVRRHRLNDSDAEEFRSLVYMKLVDNDYAVLRQWKKQANLRTYLTSVVTRQCLDYRTAQWGRWRASAEAQRQGEQALILERLMSRDGFSFGEASEFMRTNLRLAISDEELERLRGLLPDRVRRRQIEDDDLTSLPAEGPDAESAAIEAEGRAEFARLAKTLDQVLHELDPQERLLLKILYWDDSTVAKASRMLGEEGLYRKRDQILEKVRKRLQDEGFTLEMLRKLLDDRRGPDDSDDDRPDLSGRNADSGPSL